MSKTEKIQQLREDVESLFGDVLVLINNIYFFIGTTPK